ncbi:MAG TPA: hypothetical protein VE569_03780 [Acidimicrobiia bacterium]|nr:hypothetical protein [Acidimicrobiia bacterium]
MTVLGLGVLMFACTDNGSSRHLADTTAPPITESETGRIVGQPIEVASFRVDVTDAGTAVFVVSGSVPSDCHEATFGFEEPNADGVMIGEAESWVDPDCEAQEEPTEFTESMEVRALPPGEYLARLDGEYEATFVISEATSTTSTVEEARSPSSFTPLGAAECSPPSPFLSWPEDSRPGGLAEIRATSSDIDVWGLLWRTPPLPVDDEVKMVWRATGTGEFDIQATQGASEAELTFGPSLHHGSTFQRPGDEWGTAFIFPSPGCWEIEITRGADSAYVWVRVEA